MDKTENCMVINIHCPTQEGNFCDEQGNVIKPEMMTDYNHHRGYMDNSDRMPNSCSSSHQTWKWMKKLFSHLFDLIILNCCILYSCNGRKFHTDFRLALLRNMLAVADKNS
jgi:hypothetical protein